MRVDRVRVQFALLRSNPKYNSNVRYVVDYEAMLAGSDDHDAVQRELMNQAKQAVVAHHKKHSRDMAKMFGEPESSSDEGHDA